MDKFTKVTIASILILIFLIFFFIFLGTFRKNHIREINISGGEESANFSDSKLIVKFARPIQRENIKERISISPETEFNVNFINNDLQLTFPNDLDESREYKVTLKKGILDIYGDELEGEFNYEFQTKKEYITYLNKGVGGDKDKIIQSNKEFNNKKILFESEKIKDFKKYENNLLVTIVNSDLTENLILKNLGLNSIRDFKLEKESILSIDINDNSVLFLSQRVEPKGRFLAPQGNSSINLFDI